MSRTGPLLCGGAGTGALSSRVDGRTSATTYDSFGENFTITLPAAEKTLTMEAFRARVTR
ncbi:hypothetical protein OG594_16745 [Streptomyces sp. NBC_01214]|uniref:hypothetical protein n=1 Tax=Streptomyces sp. NBC_01214 TaxID=2903777 RepID=UPI002250D14D|nr:hypothetical protein [Streptomyces sp. NBC_01214]MCX4803278.1 hypothetical protein [Streptomyces sp. NBC_01214]